MRLMLRIALFFQETRHLASIESFNIQETGRLTFWILTPFFEEKTSWSSPSSTPRNPTAKNTQSTGVSVSLAGQNKIIVYQICTSNEKNVARGLLDPGGDVCDLLRENLVKLRSEDACHHHRDIHTYLLVKSSSYNKVALNCLRGELDTDVIGHFSVEITTRSVRIPPDPLTFHTHKGYILGVLDV